MPRGGLAYGATNRSSGRGSRQTHRGVFDRRARVDELPENEDRGHDREMGEQRIDVAKRALPLSLRDHVTDTAGEHGVHHA